MKLNAILTAIRGSKKRDDLHQIIHAAEVRDSKLANIESDKERKRLWAKVEKLGFEKGDMVFVHTAPTSERRYMKAGDGTIAKGRDGKRLFTDVPKFLSGQHAKLWGKPLTVQAVLPRAKQIVVRLPGETINHTLSPFTCEKLKLSKEPSGAALAKGLERVVDSGAMTMQASP